MERPAITYFISHPHAKNKKNAIATLQEVVRRLGLDIPTTRDVRIVEKDWSAQVVLGNSLLRATINIYDLQARPVVLEDELPHLDVTIWTESAWEDR